MKTKSIIQIVLLLSLAIGDRLAAQQPDFYYEHQFPNEMQFGGTHSLEIRNDDGGVQCYFVAACDLTMIGYGIGQKDQPMPARVLKLSPEGELLGEMLMNEDGRSSSIISLFHDPSDSKYSLAVGIIVDSTSTYEKPYLAKFDVDMNLLWHKEFELPEAYHADALTGGRSLMDSHGDIVFCTFPLHVSSYLSNLLYMRFSSDGEMLAMGESPLPSNLSFSSQGGLFEYKDGSGDYGQTIVGEPEGSETPPAYLLRMNREFSEFSTKDLVRNIHLSITDGIVINDCYSEAFTEGMEDGTKIMSVRGFRYDGYDPDLWDEVILAMKLDANDSIVAISFTPHDNDSVRVMAFCQGMDASADNKFFICNGVYDPRTWHGGEISGVNHFVVTKTDNNANIIWRRYYRDDSRVFQPCTVMATGDGGCLVAGRCLTQDNSETSLFVLKFFEDGSLSVSNAEALVRPYTFYPNPVSDNLNFQYSPDVQPSQIELYDLQGRMVLTQSGSLEQLNLQGLSAGEYLMKVTLDNGKAFTDKVVKQ